MSCGLAKTLSRHQASVAHSAEGGGAEAARDNLSGLLVAIVPFEIRHRPDIFSRLQLLGIVVCDR
jgi:hypothetical protein